MIVVALLALTACINEKEVATEPECAIQSFSIGNITSTVITKKYDSSGNAIDTLVQRTIMGSDIYFNIDQIHGYIHTVDSLPNWVNLSSVVPTFSCYGNVFRKTEEDDGAYRIVTSGSDSIDFSKPVELACISSDGTSVKYYTVDIYKHVNNTDTLEWKKDTTNLDIVGESKLFHVDNKVFAFAQDAAGTPIVTFAHATNSANWSVPVSIPVASGSVVLFHNQFYGLGTDGYIYRSTPEQLAATWHKASDQPVERLLAADAYYLYAYDGHAIIGSDDLDTWSLQGADDLDMLPETSLNAHAYTSNTNNYMQQVVLTGISSHNSKNGVAWYKTTSTDPNTNQSWAYIQVTPDNSYGLPHLGHLCVTRYQKALFAIGTTDGEYKYLYRSDDNGITWHPQTELYLMPADLDPANGAASIVAVDKNLWIIQENGIIWQGSAQ